MIIEMIAGVIIFIIYLMAVVIAVYFDNKKPKDRVLVKKDYEYERAMRKDDGTEHVHYEDIIY